MVYRTEMDGNNKVAVPYANYIKENAPTFTFDTVVDMNTAIQNGDVPAGAVIYCKQETPGGVSGDSALDPNSTNWVQNSAITAAMNGKASTSALQTVSDNLGSPSSASSVTGDDAFSKINTLNSDLASVSGRVSSNTLGTAVNIADKTGANTYTAPKDGYAYFSGAGTSETVLNINYTGMIASANGIRAGIFVKGGSTLFFEGVTPSWAYFKPLSY